MIDSKTAMIYINGSSNPLDYESKTQKDMKIVVQDMYGNASCLSSDAIVQITVLDVNDEPPTISSSYEVLFESSKSNFYQESIFFRDFVSLKTHLIQMKQQTVEKVMLISVNSNFLVMTRTNLQAYQFP